ncbi:Exosome component 10 [Goodea atripinnis]|uniref:Exosome component 10 n=1 Tax=Goodea atripinnis TaxID=208336 RepID=A0ABV0PNW3_9TELE
MYTTDKTMKTSKKKESTNSRPQDNNSEAQCEEESELCPGFKDVDAFVKGILLDEADGVNRSQKPIMPAGFQPPKIVVSSWNRKVFFKTFCSPWQHHSYRSFLGLTCLMQISTREEDFIIDTLELRSEMYILNEAFTDPSIVKVFHGADSDIEWLQRDFGLYVVNLFDTHQASRALNLARHSLDHLLKQFCNVNSDKRYQLADWRIRPLPDEMIDYARADTHYLLYIYDSMRVQLLESNHGQPGLLQSVWNKSKDVSLKKYVKPIYTEESYLELQRKQKRSFNTQQLTTFRLLYAWRDKLARQEDESTG